MTPADLILWVLAVAGSVILAAIAVLVVHATIRALRKPRGVPIYRGRGEQ